MPITLEDAEKVLLASKAKAEELGIQVSVAVVDARGDLVAFLRQDGVRWYTAAVAQGKALASATFGRPSADLAERADSPVMRSLLLMQEGRLVLGQGAVPIQRDSEVQGAVGVSGATGQQDEEVALAGVAAL